MRIVVKLLNDTGRPFDANGVDVCGVTQAKLAAKVVLAPAASAAGDFAKLPGLLPADQMRWKIASR